LASPDKIAPSVAAALKTFEYSAVAVFIVAVACGLAGFNLSRTLNILGTSLMAIAPVAGVLTAGIMAAKNGKRNILAYSVIIIAIYIIGFIISRYN